MIKIYEARSLLYRRQNLQENIRWKALDEIYKIYMLLHRSDLNISAKLCQTFFAFSARFSKEDAIFQHFFGRMRLKKHSTFFIEFRADFDEIFSEFRRMLRKMLRSLKFSEFLKNSEKVQSFLNSDRILTEF